MKSNQEIEMTTDYDIFKFIKGNRGVVESHVKSIMAAIQANDLCIPIVVNERMEVIDGQHTLEARKRLKEIVFYYVKKGYGLKEVQEFNTIKRKWTVEDYAHSYAELGNKHYDTYKWFRDKYKLPHIVSVQMLHATEKGHGALTNIFMHGKLEVKNLKAATDKADMIQEVAPFFKQFRDRNFVTAYLQVLEKKVFKHKVFLKRLESQPTALKKCATVEQYLSLIEDIYNYRAQKKVSLKYDD